MNLSGRWEIRGGGRDEGYLVAQLLETEMTAQKDFFLSPQAILVQVAVTSNPLYVLGKFSQAVERLACGPGDVRFRFAEAYYCISPVNTIGCS